MSSIKYDPPKIGLFAKIESEFEARKTINLTSIIVLVMAGLGFVSVLASGKTEASRRLASLQPVVSLVQVFVVDMAARHIQPCGPSLAAMPSSTPRPTRLANCSPCAWSARR
jgi:hypothetical protein